MKRDILKHKNYLITFLIFLVLIILHYSRIIAPIENNLQSLLNPLEKIIYDKSLKLKEVAFNLKTSKSELLERIRKQEIKVLDLTYENLQLKSLKEENQKLRELLNFQEITKQKILLADIVSKSNLGVSRIFNLNRGTRDGILKDQAVIAGEGTIVGKIFQTKENSSLVLLLTDNNSRLAITLENNLDTQGVLRGNQGLSLFLDLVPLDVILTPGQKVLTSGAEVGIPKGLVAGEIENVNPSDDSLFQTAVVKPIIDYDKLEVVGVVAE